MPQSLGNGQASFVSVGTTATLLVGPSETRYGMVLFSHTANRYTIGSNSGVTLDNGPTIQPGTAPFYLDGEHVGNFLRGQIWAAAAATSPVGFIECLMG